MVFISGFVRSEVQYDSNAVSSAECVCVCMYKRVHMCVCVSVEFISGFLFGQKVRSAV